MRRRARRFALLVGLIVGVLARQAWARYRPRPRVRVGAVLELVGVCEIFPDASLARPLPRFVTARGRIWITSGLGRILAPAEGTVLPHAERLYPTFALVELAQPIQLRAGADSVSMRDFPPDEPESRLAGEHVPVLLDLARAGDEATFKDLARSVGVPGEQLEELWSGTVTRLRSERVKA